VNINLNTTLNIELSYNRSPHNFDDPKGMNGDLFLPAGNAMLGGDCPGVTLIPM